MSDNFSDRVLAAMAVSGVGIPEIAEACKVSTVTVRSWLRMKEPRMLATHMHRLAVVLNVTVVWLMEGKGPRDRR